MDKPHLFIVVSLGSEQGRPRLPAATTYIRAYAAYDAWMALSSRFNVAPTSVVLERVDEQKYHYPELMGDVYELPHHGRAADLRLVRSAPAPKPRAKKAARAAEVRTPAR